MSRKTRNRSETCPLSTQHARLMVYQNEAGHEKLLRLAAITWRPGDNTGHFLGKALRPVGAAVLCIQHYAYHTYGRGENVRIDPNVPLLGFRARAHADGSIDYDESVFQYDAKRRTYPGARGRVIDPERNPSLLNLSMAMHRAVMRNSHETHRLPIKPTFPRVMLAFAPDDVPTYEETPALQHLAARRLGIPVGRLGTKDPLLLERLLHDLWEEQLRAVDAPGNDTGYVLVDAEFCSHARKALRVYEDFSQLLGVVTWNPARDVLRSERPNPAASVLKLAGIDYRQPDWQEGQIGMDTMDALEAAMRRALGPGSEMFAQEDIYDALANPNQKANASKSAKQMLAAMGEDVVIRHMRSLLPELIVEGCTDDDLRAAAQNPAGPLIASGLCQVQVIYMQGVVEEEAFNFSPDILGRKIQANLHRSWDRPERQEKPKELSQHEEPAAGATAG